MPELTELTDDVVARTLTMPGSGEVLSVILGADATDPARLPLELRAERERVMREFPGSVMNGPLEAALDEAEQIAVRLSERRPARMSTVAGFIPLETAGEPGAVREWIALPEPELTRLHIGRTPHVLALLRQLELHRAAVVVLVERTECAILDWHAGELVELFRTRVEASDLLLEQLVPQLVQAVSVGRERCFWFGQSSLVESIQDAVRPQLPDELHSIHVEQAHLLGEPLDSIRTRIQQASEDAWHAASERARKRLADLPPSLRVEGADAVLQSAEAGQVQVGFVHGAISDGELHPDWIETLDEVIGSIARHGGIVRVLDGGDPNAPLDVNDDSRLVAAALRW